jgi:hypothetical protein
MKRTKYLGMAMVISGAVLILAGGGAFGTTESNRGVAIDAANDPNVLAEVEYPEGKLVNLQSASVDAGGICIFLF